tara:strand:- start:8037 stop:8378 length:342 start_codon:yes stop_codon:yes gene_type:complete
MKITTLCAVAAMAMLTVGCAGRASSIAPTAIASTDYSNMSCEASREALVGARAREAALARRQNRAATVDAAGVALLFLPLGSVFGGDVAGELAQAKGEVAALERHIVNRCAPT